MYANKLFRRYFALLALSLALMPLPGSVQAAVEVAPPFRDYYNAHQGLRVLGFPLSGLLQVEGFPAQYFEKGRIEDHRTRERDPNWAFLYGRLVPEMMDRLPTGRVSGTTLLYSDLEQASDPAKRVAPPPNFTGGVMQSGAGTFIPFDAGLRPAPGQIVPPQFWNYINRRDLFPGGWLHDVGLPISAALPADAFRGQERRAITLQAFERAVLTYEPTNPLEWQVERGNIGADAFATLPATPATGIQVPASGQRVALPLRILARAGTPGERVSATLTWQDGTRLSDNFTLLRGEDGRGLLIDSLDWLTEGRPPQPRTQPAILEIRGVSGSVLTRQTVTVLDPNGPEVIPIKVYWVDDNLEAQAVTQLVPRTEQIAAAALEELLWGPGPRVGGFSGFGTALPLPAEILEPAKYQRGWGPRITLRKLTIQNGVATADFSDEINAYGGGSARVLAMTDQITLTLKQFPTVREVRIAVEGQTQGVLQP